MSAVKIAKDWVKGHIRVGAASMGLGRFTDAREAYDRALALDTDNEQIIKSLKEAGGAEAAAVRTGNFVFQSKRKTAEGSGSKRSAVPATKHLRRDTKLLSFDDDV